MTDSRLNHSEFFERLTALFTDRRASSHGSIFLSQKRLLPAGTKAPTTHDDLSDLTPLNAPLPILIRASNSRPSKAKLKHVKDAKRVKLSTVVESDDLEAFYARYAECCKAGASALKKRDKKKSKAAAKKKKTKPTPVPAT